VLGGARCSTQDTRQSLRRNTHSRTVLGESPPATEKASESHANTTSGTCGTLYGRTWASLLVATRSPAQVCGTDVRARRGANTPLPLRRSPPASFKRLLGGDSGVLLLPALKGYLGVQAIERAIRKKLGR